MPAPDSSQLAFSSKYFQNPQRNYSTDNDKWFLWNIPLPHPTSGHSLLSILVLRGGTTLLPSGSSWSNLEQALPSKPIFAQCIELNFWDLQFLPSQRLFLSRKEEILSPSSVSFIIHPQFPSETAQDFENYSTLARLLRIYLWDCPKLPRGKQSLKAA